MSGIKNQTAPAVQTSLDASAHFVGKTVTDELAFSMTGNNAHFGAPSPRGPAGSDRSLVALAEQIAAERLAAGPHGRAVPGKPP